MLDTINDGYIDPFDWTTRLLDILRIQFKNDDEESAENLVEAKQFSSQRLLVSTFVIKHKKHKWIKIFLVPLHTIFFLSYYGQINCYVYLGIHSAQTLIIFGSFNVKALRKKLTGKIKFDILSTHRPRHRRPPLEPSFGIAELDFALSGTRYSRIPRLSRGRLRDR